jgi:hypothetical protein
MSRMIDRLCLAGVTLGGMQSVVIDNAAEYFLTTRLPMGWDRDTFTLADFPQCLSPWRSAFVEFRLPASERAQHREAPYGVGMAVYSIRKTDLATRGNAPEGSLPSIQQAIVRTYPHLVVQSEWLTSFALWLENSHRVLAGPLANYTFFHTANGDLLWNAGNVPEAIMADMQCAAFNSPQEQRDFAKRVMTPYLFPFLFAFSLANCKNVTTSLVDPPEKLSRAHRRRHGMPLSRYYTLNIEPMKKVLREEGKVESHGLKHALSVCRGHFANYTAGKGLFGKYHGQFWIPQHVRGSANQGVVTKDYAVNAPRETP